MDEKINKARQAGYSDAEIASYLSKSGQNPSDYGLSSGNYTPAAVDTAQKRTAATAYNGLCEKFVEQASYGKSGIFPSAIAAWTGQQDKAIAGINGIKPGDAVYFNADSSNGGFGHTGIYLGEGKMLSATYNGLQESDLGSWQKQTGQKILGYVPLGQ